MKKHIFLKEVVVTGIGLITPLGLNVQETWQNMLSEKSGIQLLKNRLVDNFPEKFPQVAGFVPSFKPKDLLSLYTKINLTNALTKIDDCAIFALIATLEALKSAQLNIPLSSKHSFSTAVIIGTGAGGQKTVESGQDLVKLEKLPAKFIVKALSNLIAGTISIVTGALGINLSLNSACASGAHAIGESMRKIQVGECNLVISGGCESTITLLNLSGFNNIKALTRNPNPQEACRPFDEKRNGFVMSEGAGILILEEKQHALARNAPIYAELVGYGANSDAYGYTEPTVEGNIICMQKALKEAAIKPQQIDLINPHATSTPKGDTNEAQSLKNIFSKNKDTFITANKSQLGHTLGAAGAIEAIFTILSLQEGLIPPILNLKNLDAQCQIGNVKFVTETTKTTGIKYAISNSFGFGGTNASLIFKKY